MPLAPRTPVCGALQSLQYTKAKTTPRGGTGTQWRSHEAMKRRGGGRRGGQPAPLRPPTWNQQDARHESHLSSPSVPDPRKPWERMKQWRLQAAGVGGVRRAAMLYRAQAGQTVAQPPPSAYLIFTQPVWATRSWFQRRIYLAKMRDANCERRLRAAVPKGTLESPREFRRSLMCKHAHAYAIRGRPQASALVKTPR